jgi:hypothetical protein
MHTTLGTTWHCRADQQTSAALLKRQLKTSNAKLRRTKVPDVTPDFKVNATW